jgi:hypothetical protein
MEAIMEHYDKRVSVNDTVTETSSVICDNTTHATSPVNVTTKVDTLANEVENVNSTSEATEIKLLQNEDVEDVVPTDEASESTPLVEQATEGSTIAKEATDITKLVAEAKQAQRHSEDVFYNETVAEVPSVTPSTSQQVTTPAQEPIQVQHVDSPIAPLASTLDGAEEPELLYQHAVLVVVSVGMFGMVLSVLRALIILKAHITTSKSSVFEALIPNVFFFQPPWCSMTWRRLLRSTLIFC